MGRYTIVISSDNILKQLSREFDLVSEMPSRKVSGVNYYEVLIIDRRSEAEIGEVVQNIYKQRGNKKHCNDGI